MKRIVIATIILLAALAGTCYPGADVIPSASDIDTSTTNFNNNLSVADNTAQKAFDTIDNFALGITQTNADLRYLQLTGGTLTGAETINCNSATALKVEQTGVKNNVLVVDTTNGRVGVNRTPGTVFEIGNSSGSGGYWRQFLHASGYWVMQAYNTTGLTFDCYPANPINFEEICRFGSPNELNPHIRVDGENYIMEAWEDDTTRKPILFPSTITIGSAGSTAGVNLSGANGILTLLGAGTGADENLLIDLNTTADNVIFSSTTGVTDLDYSALNIKTTGTLGAGAITGTGLKILEGGATPTLYGIFSVPDLSTADKTYTFPTVSGSMAYSVLGTYAGIDSYINQAVLTTSNVAFGVTTLSGHNNNAAFTLLNLNNTATPATGNIGQTSDLVFNLTQYIGTTASLREAAKIRAYKVSDWVHATTEANTDSGLKFYTTNNGVSTLALTIDNVGLSTFAGGISVPSNTGKTISTYASATGVGVILDYNLNVYGYPGAGVFYNAQTPVGVGDAVFAMDGIDVNNFSGNFIGKLELLYSNVGATTFAGLYGFKVAEDGVGADGNGLAFWVDGNDLTVNIRPIGDYLGYTLKAENADFSGKVGIGITPTAVLHLKAGTATAGTAPLKLTAGVVTTAAVSGQLETDASNNLYYTNAVPTRGQIPLATAANTLFFTTTGATNVTLPTTGTLAALGGANTWTGNNIFGDASTDTYTHVGRMIVRTTASDPQHATAGSRPAGSVGEIIFYQGDWYGCTNSDTPTWVKFTSS